MTEMLTARQEAFCRAFVAGAGSAAEAARQAGYSAQTARAQASRLLHTPAVTARIDTLRAHTEQARAAVCARLWQQTQRLAERAEAEGKLGLAMRGVAMQMQMVKQFGLPAVPEDTTERTLDGLGADAVELCGDVAVGEPDPDGAGAAPPDVAATTETLATDVDENEQVAGDAATAETAGPSHTPQAAASAPRPGAPRCPRTRVINGATAAALRGFVLTDGDGCERDGLFGDVDNPDVLRPITYAGYRPLPHIAPTGPGYTPYDRSTRATRDSPRRAAWE